MMKKLSALALLLSMQGIQAGIVNVYNMIPVNMYARYNYRGNFFRRTIPAATLTPAALEELKECRNKESLDAQSIPRYPTVPDLVELNTLNKGSLNWQAIPRTPIPNTMGHAAFYQTGEGGTPKAIHTAGWMRVNDWRWHIGFSDVHTMDAKVGDIWGRNPETGCPLVFTKEMFEQKKGVDYKLGQCWGIQPKFYSSIGQFLFQYFALIVVPVRNAADNNNWWPSFRIIKLREGKTNKNCPWKNGCDELQWP